MAANESAHCYGKEESKRKWVAEQEEVGNSGKDNEKLGVVQFVF